MTTIGVDLQSVADKETFALVLKSLAVEEPDIRFCLLCPDGDFVRFQDFKQFRKGTKEDFCQCPIQLTDYGRLEAFDAEEDLLLLPISQESGKEAYLLVATDVEAARDRVDGIRAALEISKKDTAFFGRDLEAKDLFKGRKALVVMDGKDYRQMLGLVDALGQLLVARERKKGVFTEIGNYFFKNYIHHPEKLTRKTLFSTYALGWSEGRLLVGTSQQMDIPKWKELLQLAFALQGR